MLAIAMNNLGIEADKQRILVNELPKDFSRIEFNPETFSSGARTEALCVWARLIVEPAQVPEAFRDRLLRLAESSASLSTQENFWLLVAFKAMMKTLPVASIKGTTPKPAMFSANASSASWGRKDLAKTAEFCRSGSKTRRELCLEGGISHTGETDITRLTRHPDRPGREEPH